MYVDVLGILCPEGMKYAANMPACIPTCSESCDVQPILILPVEGCMCAPGTVLNGDKCSPIAECGCVLPDGTYMEVNAHSANTCYCRLPNELNPDNIFPNFDGAQIRIRNNLIARKIIIHDTNKPLTRKILLVIIYFQVM